MPDDRLRDRVLDLEPGVQLDEGERAVRPDEELERAGVAVADVPARALGGGLHLLAQLVVERGRRRLLDQLLVAALHRALALAAREDVAVVVAEHLDLDVARRRDDLLDVERAVAERRLRLARRALVGVTEIAGFRHEAHAFAAAARRRLEQHREAELLGRRARVDRPGDALGARHERNAGGAHLRLRARLVPHPLHHVRGRADEDEVVVLAGADEVGVLGEEAVAGMNGLAAGRLGGGDESRDAEVALGRGAAGRSAPRGRRAGRGAHPRPRSSTRRRPRRRARAAPGSRGRRSRRGSLRGRG